MNQERVPCLYFPTTIVFVDDDETFLTRLGLEFGRKWLHRSFNNPKKALHFLSKEYHPNPFTTRCMHEPIDQDPDKRNIEINIRAIRQELYNPNRFSEISVIVLDYMMPGLDGGELAKQLKTSPFKKILLTGEADEQVAIKLFNQGLIHRYIRKDDPNFNTILHLAIDELQREYFQDLSAIILDSLAQSPDFPHIWFKEPEFKKLLNHLCATNQIVEYYLLDEFGSFLLLNKDAQPNWLIMKNEQEIAGLCAHAEFEDAPTESIINAMKSKQYIPYFHTDKDLQTPPSAWDKYFHPAKHLQGENTYYYAYIKDPYAYDIEPKKIMSYQKYLHSHH